jgi:tellurite resistance protein
LNLIRLWNKFEEISADRLGYLAAPDLEVCVTTFFKLASGLSFDKVKSFQFNPADYMQEVDSIIENYENTYASFEEVHPANPIRIKAIEIFSKSELYQKFAKDGIILDSDKNLSKDMQHLAKLMELHPDNDRDFRLLTVLAAGGLIMASVDHELKDDEKEQILNMISNYTAYPQKFLDHILEKYSDNTRLTKATQDAIDALLEKDPTVKDPIFHYFCQIAMSDRELNQKEVDLLMKIGTKWLGLHKLEVCRLFVNSLHMEQFQPKFK